MILHTPLPKLVILGRQGLETWENRGREVGEPNEREKGGELCKNAYYFGAIEKGLKGESQEKRSRNRKYKVFCSNPKQLLLLIAITNKSYRLLTTIFSRAKSTCYDTP